MGLALCRFWNIIKIWIFEKKTKTKTKTKTKHIKKENFLSSTFYNET